MIDLRYLADPVNDDEDEPQKEETPEQSPYLMKKMEQLFLKKQGCLFVGTCRR